MALPFTRLPLMLPNPALSGRDLQANCGNWVCIFSAEECFTKLTYTVSFLDLTYELTLKSSDQTGKNFLPKSERRHYFWFWHMLVPFVHQLHI